MSAESLVHTSPRPDPRRTSRDLYPYMIDVRMRFADQDALGHLNNVKQNELYEEARVSMHRLHLDWGGDGVERRGLVTQNTLHYLSEGLYPATLSVGVGVGSLGRTSYSLGCAIFVEDRCLGLCDTLMVITDDAGPTPLPAGLRRQLEEWALRMP